MALSIFSGGDYEQLSERTQMQQRSSTPTSALTAYYLYEIVHPLGDKILFTYQNEATYDVNYSQSHEISVVTGHTFQVCSGPTTNTDYLSGSILTGRITNGKVLSKIWSPRTSLEIIFDSEPTRTVLGYQEYQYQRVLNNISVKYKDEIIEDINFKYISTSVALT